MNNHNIYFHREMIKKYGFEAHLMSTHNIYFHREIIKMSVLFE